MTISIEMHCWEIGRPVMKKETARELLLMQSSDWPFAIHSAAATDYGIGRFCLHAARFDRLASIAKSLAGSKSISDVQQTELAEADAHDVIFDDVDLGCW